ncbi:MAG: DUF488 domain-containing protein [Thermodesulfobacteriota bacterium]
MFLEGRAVERVEIRIKRVYESASGEDGQRILVDRLWPRGISKEKAQICFWAKELAPSTALRLWYGHDPAKWEEFKARYFRELDANPAELEKLLEYIRKGPVTLPYSSTERRINNAAALKEYLEARGQNSEEKARSE